MITHICVNHAGMDAKRLANAPLLAFEHLTGLFTTIHDMRGILCDENGRFLFPERKRHMHPYCECGRFTQKGWNSKCIAECQRDAESVATKTMRPFTHECWKGVSELVVPVVSSGTVFMLVYAGVFKRRRNSRAFSGANAPIKEGFEKLPFFSAKDIASLKEVLVSIGQSILASLPLLADSGQRSDRQSQINHYISENSHADASLGGLAKHLHLSPSRTRHLVVECFGAPFHELLLRERMCRCRNLLISGSLSLQEIAMNAGFGNVFYFSRRFKDYYGMPPGFFRKSQAQ